MRQFQLKLAQFHVGKFMEGLQCVPSMPATVVLGAQWGDEGKGKMVDNWPVKPVGWLVSKVGTMQDTRLSSVIGH